LQNPEDAVQDISVVCPRSAAVVMMRRVGEEMSNYAPLFVGKLHG
jgi:hypothetical protein